MSPLPTGTARAIRAMMAADDEIARTGPQEKWLEPYACFTRERRGSLTCEARTRHHVVLVDEPEQYGGSDVAPNPIEAVLAALGASLQVTTRLYATAWGIEMDRLGVHMDGMMDIRGFFDAHPDIPAGLVRLDATLTIDGALSTAELERLSRRVERACPVLSLLGGTEKVNLRIALENLDTL